MPSPYEITKPTNYHNQFHVFDELIKSTQEQHREVPEVPCFLRIFNSPGFQSQGFPYGPMNFQTQAAQPQPTQQQYNTKKIKSLQKELLKFDSSLNKDI